MGVTGASIQRNQVSLLFVSLLENIFALVTGLKSGRPENLTSQNGEERSGSSTQDESISGRQVDSYSLENLPWKF